jgi:hypothetical protein
MLFCTFGLAAFSQSAIHLLNSESSHASTGSYAPKEGEGIQRVGVRPNGTY